MELIKRRCCGSKGEKFSVVLLGAKKFCDGGGYVVVGDEKLWWLLLEIIRRIIRE